VSEKEEVSYERFLEKKAQADEWSGFDPLEIPDFLFDFQKSLTDYSIRKGRSAIYAGCGLGKTPMQLVWADNVVRKTNRPVLILTPLAVSAQTVREAKKFGVGCKQSRDGKIVKGINVTNYEKLKMFDPKDFAGVVCDESGAIKCFTTRRRQEVTDFMRGMKYRLLCTATPAPNDYIELGTSSEALGYLGRMDMLATFFKNDEKSLHPAWYGSKWRMKAHVKQVFWRWVCSWARAIRKPSDLGFDDGDFLLPPLNVEQHRVNVDKVKVGFGFNRARTLKEQRDERKGSIRNRCEKVAALAAKHDSSVIWCHLNEEGNILTDMIPGAVQVAGSDRDEVKEERLLAFADGKIKKLVTKPKIGCFGMNWQHCSHMTFFPSHSFEQWFQSIHRCWRFGQKNRVQVDVVTTEGEAGILGNLLRKAKAADEMFENLVKEMRDGASLDRSIKHTTTIEVPSWL
jgi:hypothetical protein